MRRAAKIALRTGLASLALFALVLAALLTGPGQALALRLAAYAASNADSSVAIGRLDGSLLSAGRIERIAVADREGEWLIARDVRFSWSPARLLAGLIDVEHLIADRVDLLRQPIPTEQQRTADSTSGPPLVPITAQRLEVAKLVLHAPVAGTPASLSIAARADLADASKELSAALHVRRLDAPGGQLDLDATYRAATGHLDIRVTGAEHEHEHGLLARLLDLPTADPLSLSLTGSGPLDRWRAQWALSAAQKPFVAGSAAIDRDGDRHRFEARSQGYLQKLVPASLSGILAGKITLSLSGHFAATQSITLEKLDVATDALNARAAGGFDIAQNYLYGDAELRIAAAGEESVPILLPSGQHITLASMHARLSLPDDRSQRQATATIDVGGIAGALGTVESVQVSATALQHKPIGLAAFDAQHFEVVAVAEGVHAQAPGVGAAIGSRIEAKAVGQRIQDLTAISDFRLTAQTLSASGNARSDDSGASASVAVQARDLGYFAALVGRGVGGSAVLRANAMVAGDGVLKLSLDGAAEGLRAGDAVADRLLAGTTRLKAEIEGKSGGELTFNALTVSNANFSIAASGRGGGDAVQLDVRGDIPQLSMLSSALAGSAALQLNLDGTTQSLSSRARIEGRDVLVNGHPLRAPLVELTGSGGLTAHAGTMRLAADLAGEPISGSSRIAMGDAGLSVEDATLAVGTARATGTLHVAPGLPPLGEASIDVPSLSALSALAGRPLDGSAKATLALGKPGGPQVALRASAPAIRAGSARLQGLTASLDVVDTAAVRFNGNISVAQIEAGSTDIRDASLDARDGGGDTAFRIRATIDGLPAEARGNVAQKDDAFVVTFSEARTQLAGVAVGLDGPATIITGVNGVRVEKLRVKAGAGSAQLSGSAGSETIALSLALQRLPASLGNAFDASLDLEGYLDGRIDVTGTPDAPKADAKVQWSSAATAHTRTQNLPPISVDMTARYADDAIKGHVRAGGIAGLDANASVTASLGTGRIDVRTDGTVPLSLANAFLADRNGRATGTVRFNADVTGRLDSPQVAGNLHIEGATLSDPGTGLQLVGVSATAQFTRTALVIERLAGTSAKGGSLAAQGRIGLVEQGAPSVSLRLDLDGLKFDDRELLSGEVDGRVTLEGPLSALLAAGTVHIRRLDVIVPSEVPRSIAALDLQHVNAPPNTHAARIEAKGARRSEPSVAISLALDVEAANRIFVRGRGLDVQLGGSLKVRGTAARPAANGGFAIERGRLDILGRQLNFRHGRLNFTGDIEPTLDMEAVANADGATISVFVTGPASKPKFRFASSPALPEDEVVARLLFNKSLAKLSPVQLAQLASEVDKIGGLSSGPSALDQVKGALGVDVLDVSTNDQNSTEVSAGKYVGEGTYVGVRQGSSASSSRVVIDHDLTQNLKARGELGADGNSKIGVGVEWDY